MKVVSYSRPNVVVAGVLVLALVIVAVSFYTHGEKLNDGDIINQNRKKRSPDRECTCGEGLRVKRHCSDTEDVECETCPTGTYSNSVDNSMNSCQDCTFVHCPQYSVKVSPCTAEGDIVCECKQGYEKLFVIGDRGFSCLPSYATAKECTCGEGLRVKRHCSDTEDVECEKCPTGTYSNTVDNLMNSCQDCTFVYCPKYSVQVSPCTAEGDIVCQCKQGYEKLLVGGDRVFSCVPSYATAKECTCGEGLRVKRQCSDTEDVECEKCPTGTYSNTVDNFMNSCQYCTFVYCPMYSVQVSPCTAEGDIVCECKQGYEKLFVIGDRVFSCVPSYATAKADMTTEIAKIVELR